ncbi:MAG: type II toxin-antitoxin system HicA family toxin [Candidatus Diapherotrites archaeon]|nr:type II toxin-antitoxin system HicA family toxin [Candidatus Diapherotrites archaeon]
MPKIPPLSGLRLIKILEKVGFHRVRQKGSHVILINKKRVKIVVPMHPNKKVKPSLVRVIIKQAGLTREEFFRLLENRNVRSITFLISPKLILLAGKRILAKESNQLS